MSEIDLEDVIERTLKKVLGGKENGGLQFETKQIPGSVLAEASCPHCGQHGLVAPQIIEKEKPVEVIKEVNKEPDPRQYIKVQDADFNTLSPYLSKHQNGKSLFECDNCETPAFEWMMQQKGFDDWVKKHGYRIVKK